MNNEEIICEYTYFTLIVASDCSSDNLSVVKWADNLSETENIFGWMLMIHQINKQLLSFPTCTTALWPPMLNYNTSSTHCR